MENKKKKGKFKIKTRREFLKTFFGMAASALVLGSCSPGSENGSENGEEPQALVPRTGVTNPFVTDTGMPILVCIWGTDFARMLRAGMETLGGFGRLVGNRDVLVKPNLNHRDPYPGISSPDSIATIVREVNEVTTGTVYAGDMGYYTTVYDYLGLEGYVNNAGGILVDFSEAYRVRQNFWESSKPDFFVYSDVYNAPVIISTCCLKRHHTASLTCAIKCNVGCVRGPGASGTRSYIHYQSRNFMAELAEIAGLVNLELTIVDARSILTVSGPEIREGTVVAGVNRVIICGDMVATDVYCARIMEEYDNTFSISSIEETLQHAVELGLGTSDLNQVEIIEIQT